jgi:hypothetical protein
MRKILSQSLGILILLGGGGARPPAALATQTPADIEQFGFVVGDWRGTFKAYATPAMPTAFEAPASMSARWGPQHAWVDSEANTEIPGLGPYNARVLVAFDSQSGTFDSFVINTFRTSARYTGRVDGKKVVFVGTIGRETQRVTYENAGADRLLFRVEESRDGGQSYQPHSEILWRRN